MLRDTSSNNVYFQRINSTPQQENVRKVTKMVLQAMHTLSVTWKQDEPRRLVNRPKQKVSKEQKLTSAVRKLQ